MGFSLPSPLCVCVGLHEAPPTRSPPGAYMGMLGCFFQRFLPRGFPLGKLFGVFFHPSDVIPVTLPVVPAAFEFRAPFPLLGALRGSDDFLASGRYSIFSRTLEHLVNPLF